MPDVRAGSYAVIDGEEFVNSSRTIAYIHNFGLPLSISEDCWCPSIQDLLGPDCPPATGAGPDGEYTFPSTDMAPWYDPAIPESGDFLGFLPIGFEGLGSTYTRQTFDTLNQGAVLGRLRPQARTMTWNGFLVGRTCCAAEYGLRWLTAILSQAAGCDGCNGSEVNILLCCVEVTGGTDPPGLTCQPTALGIQAPPVGQMKNSDAFRTFYNTGLIDGPRATSERQIGCGTCEDGGSGCLLEAEFSLVAGNPFMHKDPVTACGPNNFPDCNDCVEWIKVESAEECEDLLACGKAPADCIDDPTCPVNPLPTIPDFEDPCGCEPLDMSTICCEISNDIYGQFFEGVPTIQIFSGAEPLRNLTIKFYENPQERTCDDQALFDVCNLCATANVRYMPANATLTLDGLTRTVDIECPGNNVNSAEGLLVTGYTWPVFRCINYIVTITADCSFPIAPDATATILVTPREM